MTSRKRWYFNWILSASVVLFTGTLWLFWGFRADDSYIVSRYARNLAHHGELTYNLGERICALTSPFHAIVETLLARCFADPPHASTFVCIAVVCIGLFAMMRSLRDDADAMCIAAACAIASPFLALWTIGGLETPFLFLFMTLLSTVLRRAHSGKTETSAVLTCGILIGLGFITRFDSATFTFPIGLFLLVRGRSPWRSMAALLPGALIAVGWLAFAKFYYHDIFPTSLYVKSHATGWKRSALNGANLAFFLMASGLIVPLVIALRTDVSSRAELLIRRIRAQWGIYAGLAVFLAYALTASAVHMMFAFRMIVPFIPTLVLATLDLRNPDADKDNRALPAWFFPAMPFLILVVNAMLAIYMYTQSINPLVRGEYPHESVREYVQSFLPTMRLEADEVAAHWSRQPAGASRDARVMTFAAGVLPYFDEKTYVIEPLISYRKFCTPPMIEAADYIHILAPREGTVEQQLGARLANLTLVSSHTIQFDGQSEQFVVFFQPHPSDIRLPNYVNDPCPPLLPGVAPATDGKVR